MRTKSILLGAAVAAGLCGPVQASVIVIAGGAPDEPAGQQQLIPDAPYAPVTVALPDSAPFHYLFFDLDVRDGEAANGGATFTVSLAGKPDITHSLDIAAGRRNLFTISADGDDAITALRITSDLALDKVDLLRIAAVAGGEGGVSSVPEPLTAGLLALGIIALGAARRSNRI